MAGPVLLAIDQGTTSVRASLCDGGLRARWTRSEAVERSFPRPGWVELDAEALVEATERVVAGALADGGLHARDVAAVGLANQGETVVVWERATGKPIAPAVVWQCRRTEAECARLREDAGVAAWVREATGLPIDPYFSATKLAHVLDSVPGARARADRGDLCAGTLDAFTIFRLSGGRRFVTDPSTACRTLLADLATGRFDERLCELFRVPRSVLPEVVSSDADVGPVRVGDGFATLRALLCDQPSALLGTGCTAPGDVKCTYGTGAFVQMSTGSRPLEGADGLLRSIAWEIGGARHYLLEGSVLSAGDVLTWLRDGLGMIARPEEIDDVLGRTPDSAGVLFVAALGGLGAPRWVGEARGTILGLHRATRREHLIRAALEGIAHQVADVLDVASELVARLPGVAEGPGVRAMWADGGLASSRAFLRLQADLAGRALRCSAEGEATTRGLAAVAAVGAGLASSVEEAARLAPSLVVEPALDEAERLSARARHRQLVDLATSAGVLSLCKD